MLKIVILGLFVILLGVGSYYFYVNYISKPVPETANSEVVLPKPSDTPSPRLSDDPAYKEVVDKYHLTEEQLQILSRVSSDNN